MAHPTPAYYLCARVGLDLLSQGPPVAQAIEESTSAVSIGLSTAAGSLSTAAGDICSTLGIFGQAQATKFMRTDEDGSKIDAAESADSPDTTDLPRKKSDEQPTETNMPETDMDMDEIFEGSSRASIREFLTAVDWDFSWEAYLAKTRSSRKAFYRWKSKTGQSATEYANVYKAEFKKNTPNGFYVTNEEGAYFAYGTYPTKEEAAWVAFELHREWYTTMQMMDLYQFFEKPPLHLRGTFAQQDDVEENPLIRTHESTLSDDDEWAEEADKVPYAGIAINTQDYLLATILPKIFQEEGVWYPDDRARSVVGNTAPQDEPVFLFQLGGLEHSIYTPPGRGTETYGEGADEIPAYNPPMTSSQIHSFGRHVYDMIARAPRGSVVRLAFYALRDSKLLVALTQAIEQNGCSVRLRLNANVLEGYLGDEPNLELKRFLDRYKGHSRVRVLEHRASIGQYWNIDHAKLVITVLEFSESGANPTSGGYYGNIEAGAWGGKGCASHAFLTELFDKEFEYLSSMPGYTLINGKDRVHKKQYHRLSAEVEEILFRDRQKAHATFYKENKEYIDGLHEEGMKNDVLVLRPCIPLGPTYGVDNGKVPIENSLFPKNEIDKCKKGETVIFSSMYSHKSYVQHLINFHERGGNLVVICSKFQGKIVLCDLPDAREGEKGRALGNEWEETVQKLIDAGVFVLVVTEPLLHWKFLYTSQVGLWTGTPNFSPQAFHGSNVGEIMLRVGQSSHTPFFHMILKTINGFYPEVVARAAKVHSDKRTDVNRQHDRIASHDHMINKANGWEDFLNSRPKAAKAVKSRVKFIQFIDKVDNL